MSRFRFAHPSKSPFDRPNIELHRDDGVIVKIDPGDIVAIKPYTSSQWPTCHTLIVCVNFSQLVRETESEILDAIKKAGWTHA